MKRFRMLNLVKPSFVSKRQIIAAPLLLATSLTPVLAAELGVSYLKGSDSGVNGYSFEYINSFGKKSSFYWSVGYSSMKGLPVSWNQDELTFDINQVDVKVSYRHKFRSYNQFVNKLTAEFLVGGSVMTTENKFVWPQLNEEKFFSEKGDVSAFAGIALLFEASRNTSIVFGVRLQPEVSEFDDVSSAYIGVNYRFSQAGY
ncbi:hypothetical protein [Thalassotalea ganghwensis]